MTEEDLFSFAEKTYPEVHELTNKYFRGASKEDIARYLTIVEQKILLCKNRNYGVLSDVAAILEKLHRNLSELYVKAENKEIVSYKDL